MLCGLSSRAVMQRIRLTDHPHARGENPNDESGRRRNHRTIPTRVGKTPASARSAQPVSDHPHARGENALSASSGRFCCGPSPRAWGKPFGFWRRKRRLRTIPTRVGKTRGMPSSASGPSDHPHARGENALHPGRSNDPVGPSPRAWGKHCLLWVLRYRYQL